MWRWLIWHLKGWLWQRWYKIYRKTDTWAKKRARIYKRDRYRCQVCGSRRNLQPHHLTYERVGHELDTDLVTWCEKCHMKHHGRATDVRSGKVAAVFLFFLLVLLILSRCSPPQALSCAHPKQGPCGSETASGGYGA